MAGFDGLDLVDQERYLRWAVRNPMTDSGGDSQLWDMYRTNRMEKLGLLPGNVPASPAPPAPPRRASSGNPFQDGYQSVFLGGGGAPFESPPPPDPQTMSLSEAFQGGDFPNSWADFKIQLESGQRQGEEAQGPGRTVDQSAQMNLKDFFEYYSDQAWNDKNVPAVMVMSFPTSEETMAPGGPISPSGLDQFTGRPVTRKEMTKFIEVYHGARSSGAGEAEAMRRTLAAMGEAFPKKAPPTIEEIQALEGPWREMLAGLPAGYGENPEYAGVGGPGHDTPGRPANVKRAPFIRGGELEPYSVPPWAISDAWNPNRTPDSVLLDQARAGGAPTVSAIPGVYSGPGTQSTGGENPIYRAVPTGGVPSNVAATRPSSFQGGIGQRLRAQPNPFVSSATRMAMGTRTPFPARPGARSVPKTVTGSSTPARPVSNRGGTGRSTSPKPGNPFQDVGDAISQGWQNVVGGFGNFLGNLFG